MVQVFADSYNFGPSGGDVVPCDTGTTADTAASYVILWSCNIHGAGSGASDQLVTSHKRMRLYVLYSSLSDPGTSGIAAQQAGGIDPSAWNPCVLEVMLCMVTHVSTSTGDQFQGDGARCIGFLGFTDGGVWRHGSIAGGDFQPHGSCRRLWHY